MEDQVENYDLMIGYIYRISHLDSDICYIGSTLKPIRNRYHEHLQAYNLWLKNGGTTYSIYPYFKQYGVKRFKISVVKEYEVIDSRHLQMYEQLWIEKSRKTCVNVANAFALKFLTAKAYRLKMKDKLKARSAAYYEANKEKCKDYTKLHYASNKDKYKTYYEADKDNRKEKSKTYYADNKDKIKASYDKEKSKAYYEANKEKVKEYQDENRDNINKKRNQSNTTKKTQCECGSTFVSYNLKAHLQTKKHSTWAQNSL